MTRIILAVAVSLALTEAVTAQDDTLTTLQEQIEEVRDLLESTRPKTIDEALNRIEDRGGWVGDIDGAFLLLYATMWPFGLDPDMAEHMTEQQIREYDTLRWVGPAILDRLTDTERTFNPAIGTTYFLIEARSITRYAVACFPTRGLVYPYAAVKHAELLADHFMTGALLKVRRPNEEHCPLETGIN